MQGVPQITLSNVLLQGAAFDGSRLRPVTPESPISNPTPPVVVAWVPKQQPDLYEMCISAPLYSESDRRNVIAHLHLPVLDSSAKEQYLLAGVAASLLA